MSPRRSPRRSLSSGHSESRDADLLPGGMMAGNWEQEGGWMDNAGAGGHGEFGAKCSALAGSPLPRMTVLALSGIQL